MTFIYCVFLAAKVILFVCLDPFSPKRNVARSMYNTRVFDYFYNCLRKASLYFSLPTSHQDLLEYHNKQSQGKQHQRQTLDKYTAAKKETEDRLVKKHGTKPAIEKVKVPEQSVKDSPDVETVVKPTNHDANAEENRKNDEAEAIDDKDDCDDGNVTEEASNATDMAILEHEILDSTNSDSNENLEQNVAAKNNLDEEKDVIEKVSELKISGDGAKTTDTDKADSINILNIEDLSSQKDEKNATKDSNVTKGEVNLASTETPENSCDPSNREDNTIDNAAVTSEDKVPEEKTDTPLTETVDDGSDSSTDCETDSESDREFVTTSPVSTRPARVASPVGAEYKFVFNTTTLTDGKVKSHLFK